MLSDDGRILLICTCIVTHVGRASLKVAVKGFAKRGTTTKSVFL